MKKKNRKPGESSLPELLAKRKDIYATALRHQTEAKEAMEGEDIDRSKFDTSMEAHDRAVEDLNRVDALVESEKKLISEEVDKLVSNVEEKKELHEQAFMTYLMGGYEGKQAVIAKHGQEAWNHLVWAGGKPPVTMAASADDRQERKTTAVLAPEIISSEIIRTMKDWGGLIERSRIINTDNGRDYSFPTFDRRGRLAPLVKGILPGDILGKAKKLPMKKRTLKAYKNSTGILLYDWESLRDLTIVDIRGFIAEELAEDLARGTAALYAQGTGLVGDISGGATGTGADSKGEPLGLETALILGDRGSNLAVDAVAGNKVPDSNYWYASRVDSGAGSTTRTWYLHWQDLVNLPYLLDDAYVQGPNSGYFLGRKFMRFIMTLTDGNNRPLWQPSVRAGEPNIFAGFRYFVGYELSTEVPINDADKALHGVTSANDLRWPTNDGFLVGFGDLRKYAVRNDGGVRIKYSDEYKFDTDQFAYVLLNRFDARVLDYNAFAVYVANPNDATKNSSLGLTTADQNKAGTRLGSSVIALRRKEIMSPALFHQRQAAHDTEQMRLQVLQGSEWIDIPGTIGYNGPNPSQATWRVDGPADEVQREERGKVNFGDMSVDTRFIPFGRGSRILSDMEITGPSAEWRLWHRGSQIYQYGARQTKVDDMAVSVKALAADQKALLTVNDPIPGFRLQSLAGPNTAFLLPVAGQQRAKMAAGEVTMPANPPDDTTFLAADLIPLVVEEVVSETTALVSGISKKDTFVEITDVVANRKPFVIAKLPFYRYFNGFVQSRSVTASQESAIDGQLTIKINSKPIDALDEDDTPDNAPFALAATESKQYALKLIYGAPLYIGS